MQRPAQLAARVARRTQREDGSADWACTARRLAAGLLFVLVAAFALAAIAGSGQAVVLVPLWLLATWLAARRPWPVLIGYVLLVGWLPDYVGFDLRPILQVDLGRLVGLALLPGLLLGLLVRPDSLRRLGQPLSVAILTYWLVNAVTPLWSIGQVTPTGAIRDGLLDGLDYFIPSLLVLCYADDLPRARAVVRTLLVGALALLGLAVEEFASGHNRFLELPPLTFFPAAPLLLLERGGLTRAQVTYGAPLALGRYFALLAPLALWLVIESRDRLRRWGHAVATAGCALGVLVTVSGTPLAGLGLGLIAGARACWRRSLPALGLTLLVVVGFEAAVPNVVEVSRGWLGGESPTSEEARHNFEYRKLLPTFVRFGLEHSLLFGYGNGGSIPTIPFDPDHFSSLSADYRQDVLNVYVKLLLEHGLVGVVSHVAVMVTAFWTLASVRPHPAAARRLAWLLGSAVGAQLLMLQMMSTSYIAERVFWVVLGLAGVCWRGSAVEAAGGEARNGTGGCLSVA